MPNTLRSARLFPKAAEVSEAKRFATAKLEITVKPVDVNPPEILATATEGFVEENSPVGTQVLDTSGKPISFTVTDADLVSQPTQSCIKFYIFFLRFSQI